MGEVGEARRKKKKGKGGYHLEDDLDTKEKLDR